MIGINATADSTNKLSVKSSALLFDNVGNGVQEKLNKHAAADTASLLYQTNYSGRAELGTTGDDNFHLKVSPDGSAWTEAVVIDKTSGALTLAAGLKLPNASAAAPRDRLQHELRPVLRHGERRARRVDCWSADAGGVGNGDRRDLRGGKRYEHLCDRRNRGILHSAAQLGQRKRAPDFLSKIPG